MNQLWYHGTVRNHVSSIMSNGLLMGYYEGIWGYGVYLTKNKEDALSYGDYLFVASGNMNEIWNLDYEKDVKVLYPELSHDEEECTRELRDLALSKGYKGVSMKYKNGDVHLIVYDISFITSLNVA